MVGVISAMKENLINILQVEFSSQLEKWLVKQSSEIKNRSYLIKKYEEYSKKFENKIVPRPNIG